MGRSGGSLLGDQFIDACRDGRSDIGGDGIALPIEGEGEFPQFVLQLQPGRVRWAGERGHGTRGVMALKFNPGRGRGGMSGAKGSPLALRRCQPPRAPRGLSGAKESAKVTARSRAGAGDQLGRGKWRQNPSAGLPAAGRDA